MFALTHALIAAEVLDSQDPLILFGAVLPDYIWNNRTIRYQRNIHYDPFRFYTYVKNKYETLLPFAKGILLHSDISRGVDWYSDNSETGYAVILGKQLIPEIQKSFSLDVVQAADFSHNFIEGALDLILAKENSDFARDLLGTKHLISSFKIDEVLGEFSHGSVTEARQAIDGLLRFYFRKNLQSEKLIISICFTTIAKNRFNIADGKSMEKLTPILRSAKILVLPTYKQFLAQTISSIKRDSLLKEYLMK